MSQKDKDIEKNAETADEANGEAKEAAEAKDEESKEAEGEASKDEESEEAEAKDEESKEAGEGEEAKAEEPEEEAKAASGEAESAEGESTGEKGSGGEESDAAAEDASEPERAASESEAEHQELYGVLAQYDTPGELIAAAEKVRDAGFTQWDCYSPFPVHGIDPAMGIKRTVLPWIVFAIGLCGLGGGLLLQWWTNAYNWPWIISGKPFFSIPANIPVTFETTILASVFTAFFGMWLLNKLPQVWHPFFKKDRFRKVTDDGFFIGIQASDDKFQRGKVETLLRDAGAIAVEPCYTSTDPDRRKLPKPLSAFIVVTTVLALVPFALVAKARSSKSDAPHVHIFPDMDFQPKLKSQRATTLFDDHRASRRPVEGTVARGKLKADDHFYRGIVNGEWATTFPATFEVSERMIKRGEERFGIYCQPCHGASGKGDGMVHQRTKRLIPTSKTGWVQPTNLHQDYVIRMPHGQLFNTISNGIRTMPGYAAQIPESDRWAIVLYIRALQRSQNANLSDVPPEARKEIR